MKKLIGLAITFMLLSCHSPEEERKYKEDHTYDIEILTLREVSRGKYSPDFFMIDTVRNSYELWRKDYVRLREGDSVKIYTGDILTEIVEIYP